MWLWLDEFPAPPAWPTSSRRSLRLLTAWINSPRILVSVDHSLSVKPWMARVIARRSIARCCCIWHIIWTVSTCSLQYRFSSCRRLQLLSKSRRSESIGGLRSKCNVKHSGINDFGWSQKSKLFCLWYCIFAFFSTWRWGMRWDEMRKTNRTFG